MNPPKTEELANFRQRLRIETREAHQRLDDFMQGLDPFGSVGNYAHYLEGMRQLHAVAHQSVQWAELQTGMTARTVGLGRLIESDLKSTGTDLKNKAPVAIQGLVEKSAAEKWGEAYVMEGSALGGSMLYKSATAQLPGGLGTRYLHQLSLDVSQRWPIFVKALSAADQSAESFPVHESVKAATELFDHAFKIFSR